MAMRSVVDGGEQQTNAAENPPASLRPPQNAVQGVDVPRSGEVPTRGP